MMIRKLTSNQLSDDGLLGKPEIHEHAAETVQEEAHTRDGPSIYISVRVRVEGFL